MSEKQDRTGARTPADIERKYNFSKSFSEVMGIATDARTKAETASKKVTELDENLTAEEIFNRLTDNGEKQGVFTYENGEVYINAKYITAISELFSTNITMSGTFTNEVEVFLEPGEEEIETIRQHLLGTNVLSADLQKLYDSDGNGKITLLDMADFRMAQMGEISLKDRAFAKKTKLTLKIDLKNPEKFIQYTGKNMWSRDISGYIGVYTSSHIEKEKSRMKKTLFSGTWSGGTMRVPFSDNYMLFKISLDGKGTSILAVRHGEYIRGIGGFSNATPTVTTYHFAATINSNENWTLIACNQGNHFEDDANIQNCVVTGIVGII